MARDTDSEAVAKRTVELEPVRGGEGWIATPVLWAENEDPNGVPQLYRQDTAGQYAILRLDHREVADQVRGSLPDVDGAVVMHTGDNFGKHYYRSHDETTLPVDVLEALADEGVEVLLRNVDGGWQNWDGRPEWSTTYVDYSDAEVVRIEDEIDERREH